MVAGGRTLTCEKIMTKPKPASPTPYGGAGVEPGLVAAVDVFRRRGGRNVRITFATTPEIRRLFVAGAAPDVVIAPHPALDELAKSGKVDGAARAALGRVGVGVAIRAGAPKPDISTRDRS